MSNAPDRKRLYELQEMGICGIHRKLDKNAGSYWERQVSTTFKVEKAFINAKLFGKDKFGLVFSRDYTVIDIDLDKIKDKEQAKSATDFLDSHPLFSNTWQVRTPSGGRHYVFKYPIEKVIKNRAGVTLLFSLGDVEFPFIDVPWNLGFSDEYAIENPVDPLVIDDDGFETLGLIPKKEVTEQKESKPITDLVGVDKGLRDRILEWFPECAEFHEYPSFRMPPPWRESKSGTALLVDLEKGIYCDFGAGHDEPGRACDGGRLEKLYLKMHPDATIEDVKREYLGVNERMAETLRSFVCIYRGELSVHARRHPEFSMNRAAFNSKFAGIRVKKTAPFEVATESGLLQSADDLQYYPGADEFFMSNGLTMFNTYRAPTFDSTAGGVDWFLEHLDYLFDGVDKEIIVNHLLNYIAHMVQRPGVRIRHGVLICGREQGTGKSLILETVAKLIGEHNQVVLNNEVLAEKFNGWSANSVMASLDEARIGGYNIYTKFKELIAQDRIAVREMHKQTATRQTFFHFWATSNYADPFIMDKDDRRFFVARVESPKKPIGYYIEFRKNRDRYAGALHKFFSAYEIRDLDGADISDEFAGMHPPTTRAKEQIIEDTKPDIQAELEQLIQDKIVVITKELARKIRFEDNHYKCTGQFIGRLLTEQGHDTGGKRKFDGEEFRYRIIDRIKWGAMTYDEQTKELLKELNKTDGVF